MTAHRVLHKWHPWLCRRCRRRSSALPDIRCTKRCVGRVPTCRRHSRFANCRQGSRAECPMATGPASQHCGDRCTGLHSRSERRLRSRRLRLCVCPARRLLRSCRPVGAYRRRIGRWLRFPAPSPQTFPENLRCNGRHWTLDLQCCSIRRGSCGSGQRPN
ncbi:hypothetical protein D9M72_544820 [compost metagenome]